LSPLQPDDLNLQLMGGYCKSLFYSNLPLLQDCNSRHIFFYRTYTNLHCV